MGKTTGGHGWADVWRREAFGWEYKGGGGDLAAAYRQLLNYSVALENPPLLIVSDMDRSRARAMPAGPSLEPQLHRRANVYGHGPAARRARPARHGEIKLRDATRRLSVELGEIRRVQHLGDNAA